jgi:hypothetical protein
MDDSLLKRTQAMEAYVLTGKMKLMPDINSHHRLVTTPKPLHR